MATVEPLTREEAHAVLTVCLANLRGKVIPVADLPEVTGSAMVKLRRIMDEPKPPRRRFERLTRPRLLAALGDEPQSPSDLADRLHADRLAVSSMLHSLKLLGQARHIGRGAWVIGQGEEAGG